MPWTPCAVIVEPTSLTVSVTIKRGSTAGVQVSSYTSENGASLHSYPKVITSRTYFWLTGPGQYYVSLSADSGDVGSTVVTVDPFMRASVSVVDLSVGGDELAVVADGVTEVTTTIQRAIDRAYDAGGGTVRLPSGRFLVDTLVMKSNVVLRGNGKLGSTLVAKPNSTAKGLITIDTGPVKRGGIFDLHLAGDASNTNQWGIYAEAAASTTSTTGGWWYTDLEHLSINDFVPGAIWLRGGPSGGLLPHQFIRLHGVTCSYAFGVTNTAWIGMRITGQVGQLTADVCEFTGSGAGQSAYGLLITRYRDAGDTTYSDDEHPYSLVFNQVTCQYAQLGVLIDRATNIQFNSLYLEDNLSGVQLQNSAGPVLLDVPIFADTCSNGSNTGFAVWCGGVNDFCRVEGPLVTGAVDADCWKWTRIGTLVTVPVHRGSQIKVDDVIDAMWVGGESYARGVKFADGSWIYGDGTADPTDTSMLVRSAQSTADSAASKVWTMPSGLRYKQYSGSASTYWPFSVEASGSHLKLQAGPSVSDFTSSVTVTPVIDIQSAKIGFFNTTPASKPTVSGAKGSNAALGSLLTALAALGLVTDSSST